MPADNMQSQRHIWEAHPNQHADLVWKDRLWYMAIFLAASFTCLGYVFWLVIQKGRKEQKNK
jgi:hypothetical protein